MSERAALPDLDTLNHEALKALIVAQHAQILSKDEQLASRDEEIERLKMLWWDGDGLCLFAKRLERGRFIWPQATSGTVSLTPAQLSMLLEGIDWRRPVRTQSPQLAV